jgi:hypothetical protein
MPLARELQTGIDEKSNKGYWDRYCPITIHLLLSIIIKKRGDGEEALSGFFPYNLNPDLSAKPLQEDDHAREKIGTSRIQAGRSSRQAGLEAHA